MPTTIPWANSKAYQDRVALVMPHLRGSERVKRALADALAPRDIVSNPDAWAWLASVIAKDVRLHEVDDSGLSTAAIAVAILVEHHDLPQRDFNAAKELLKNRDYVGFWQKVC